MKTDRHPAAEAPPSDVVEDGSYRISPDLVHAVENALEHNRSVDRVGTRPRAPRDQRTEWAYIFGAICPAKGKGAGLVMW